MITYLKLRLLLNNLLLCCVFLVVLPSILCAEDWPQGQGSNRDNKSKETGLLDEWPKDGPTLLWTFRHSGVGYSGRRSRRSNYIMGGRNGCAELLSIKATSGELVWSSRLIQRHLISRGTLGGWPTGYTNRRRRDDLCLGW